MTGDDDSNNSEPDRRRHKPWNNKSLIAQLHRESQKHSSGTESDAPHDPSLIGVTRWLVVWTAALVFVGICTVGAALLQWAVMSGQLTEMRNAGEDIKRAVEATNRLAKAAEDSAVTARDTEHRQLRAYVFPRVSIENVNGDVLKAETVAPKIEMHIKNTGFTPAYEISILGGAMLSAFPTILNFRYERLGIPHKAVLAAGDTDPATLQIVNAGAPVTKEQKIALVNGRLAIYLVGEILYRDTFGTLLCTKYAYYIGGDARFYGSGMSDLSEGRETDKNCHEPVRGEPPRVVTFPPTPR
jgi:hypothetical protein